MSETTPADHTVGTLLGKLTLLAVLVLGVPLFLCGPLWCDVTYHDISARNILTGGVHYRDVFETNLPGMVWIHAAVRSLIGWQSWSLRLVDLVVVGLCIWLLSKRLAEVGVSTQGRVWFAAAASAFYLFQSEFGQVQRDVWMLLPALTALGLRRRQIERMQEELPASAVVFGWALLEGIVWGIAFWIKPHIACPAAAVWLTGLARIGANAPNANRRRAVDFAGLIAGGVIAAIPGIVWMVRTGAWEPFREIMRTWNPEYYSHLQHYTFEIRLTNLFGVERMQPWCLLHIVAVPLGVWLLIQGRVWSSRSHPTDEGTRFDRALLVAFYFGWLFQAGFIQKEMDYVFVPLTLIVLAVPAAKAWPTAFLTLAWLSAAQGLLYFGEPDTPIGGVLQTARREAPWLSKRLLVEHPLARKNYLALWPRCFSEGPTPELQDEISRRHSGWVMSMIGINYTNLRAVEAYLRSLPNPPQARELVCWHDTPHPLYLWLDLRPGLRYMHAGMVVRNFPSKHEQIRRELSDSRIRYVVSDLMYVWIEARNSRENIEWDPYEPEPESPHALPKNLSAATRRTYPLNQPVLFRAGRYLVHEVKGPVGPITVAESLGGMRR